MSANSKDRERDLDEQTKLYVQGDCEHRGMQSGKGGCGRRQWRVNMVCTEQEMSSRPEITFSPSSALGPTSTPNLTVQNLKKKKTLASLRFG